VVFPVFVGEWVDMVGQYKTNAEYLAAIGSMSGHTKTYFGASEPEIRSHIAKIVGVLGMYLG
jgi:hypothetical protein